jgi:MFS family permease
MGTDGLVDRGISGDLSAEGNRYSYVIVSSAFVLTSIMWTAFYSFGIFFKPVLSEFGWTRAATAGAFSLCSIIQGLLSIAMGGLTDRFGPRVVMTLCGALLAAGYFLMSQVHSLWHLYLFFSIILGVGMGGSFVPLMTLTARWFVKRRGIMSGIVASGGGIGALLGPPAAGMLISRYGWRTSYVALGASVLVLVVLGAQVLRRAPGHMRPGDRKGDCQEDSGQTTHQGGVAFREAVCSKTFWTFVMMIFCLGFAVFAVMVHMAAHLTDLGFTQTTAANVMATTGAACIAGKVVFGRVLDRIGSWKGFLIGFALMGLSLFFLVFVNTLNMFCLWVAVFGFSYGGCVSCESPFVADVFGLRSHGLLLGIVACGFTFGGGVGPFMAGYIFDVAGTYEAAFLLCSILSFAGLLLAWMLRRPVTLGASTSLSSSGPSGA